MATPAHKNVPGAYAHPPTQHHHASAPPMSPPTQQYGDGGTNKPTRNDTPHMKTASQQPIYVIPISDPRAIVHATNDWEVPLFECFCAPIHSLIALFFPYLSAAYIAHYANRSGILAGLFFFCTCSANVATTATVTVPLVPLSAVLYLLGVLVLRHVVRDVYRIRGSSLHDFVVAFLCSCCALAQMSAHTERIRAQHEADAATLPAYHFHHTGGGDGEDAWLRRDDHADRNTTGDEHIAASYKVLE